MAGLRPYLPAHFSPWVWPPQKGRRVVLSASFGQDPVNHVTEPTRAAYARRVGATCVTLRDYLPVGDAPHWEKLRCAEWLLQGYRVLWVDSDVFIEPSAPDLFDWVAPEKLGILDERIVGEWPENYEGNRACIPVLAKRLGRACPEVPQSYYNSGVFVASPQHWGLFELGDDPAVSDQVYEQTWVNLRLLEHQVKIQPLPSWANNMNFWDVPSPHGRFLHAAGRRMEEKLLSFVALKS